MQHNSQCTIVLIIYLHSIVFQSAQQHKAFLDATEMSSDSAETLLPQGPNGEITLSSKDFRMPSTRVHDESQDRYDDPVAHQHRRDESFTRTDSGRPAEHSEDVESSASSDDSEDRALERELWDEESNIGTIKKKKTTIMQSLGRDRVSARLNLKSGSPLTKISLSVLPATLLRCRRCQIRPLESL